jgi:hypothetical protein
MPQTNKRTASLPSPHPICLQSHYSAPLGSPPLRLCQTPALCQIHTPLGSPPLRPCRAPVLCQIQTLPGSPPLETPAPQALLDPSSAWDDWIHALPEFPPLRPWASAPGHIHTLLGSPPTQVPHPSGSAGPQLHVEQLEPHPARIPTP